MSSLDFERPIRELERKIDELKELANGGMVDFGEEIKKLERKAKRLQVEIFSDLTPWQIVQLSRHPERPYFLDYVQLLFTDFMELHGDRRFAEDPALVGGFARFEGEPVLVLGHQKGRNTKENMLRNFGMPRPEGYRKALRLMQLAARFNRPILTFIDTPGAYPGIGSEERGQAQAVAECLETMAALPVPVIATVIGEGGSGGALAIGVGNRLLMMQYAYYSVISPEGCSSILFREPTKAPRAAEALKMSAEDLKSFGILDEIVPEAVGGAHRDPARTAENVARALRSHLGQLRKLTADELVDDRYRRFRVMGVFERLG
ncbi:MAG TPA: acetyl-CoA carboxylase carboxyltransferase subunit alpha [Myxococcales bacterium]|nr:acetyl-CoA carboxylase carboxyltransferase subunit alpha [Myxococcales bacterium]